MNATAWSSGLEVTGGGTGVVSHAGLVLVQAALRPHGPDRRPVAGAADAGRRPWTGAGSSPTWRARSRTAPG